MSFDDLSKRGMIRAKRKSYSNRVKKEFGRGKKVNKFEISKKQRTKQIKYDRKSRVKSPVIATHFPYYYSRTFVWRPVERRSRNIMEPRIREVVEDPVVNVDYDSSTYIPPPYEEEEEILKEVELEDRFVFDTRVLRDLSEKLYDGDNINEENVCTLLEESGSYDECLRIATYIPFNTLNSHTPQSNNFTSSVPKLLTEAKNSSLERSLIAESKFWMKNLIKDYPGSISDSNINFPFIPMISPFLLDGTCNPLFTCRMLTEDEESHIKFPSSNLNGRNIGERSITKNLERFKRNFKAFSGGILDGVHLHTGIIGGSSVCACLQPLPNDITEVIDDIEAKKEATFDSLNLPNELKSIISNEAFKKDEKLVSNMLEKHYDNTNPNSDIDIFFYGSNRTQAFNSLKSVCNQILQKLDGKLRPWKLVRSYNSITIVTGYPIRNIQLILLLLQEPRELPCFCDMDCTASYFDGVDVFCSERSLRAFNTGYNYVAPSSLQEVSCRSRLRKYSERGFGTLLYEICKHEPRCDVVPTSIVNNGIFDFKHRQYREKRIYDSDLIYGLGLSLNYIISHLKRNDSRYLEYGEPLPYIIGDSIEELLIPEDMLPYEEIPESNGSGTNVKPLRWKRDEEISRNPSLGPKCYMCREPVFVVQNGSGKRVVSICEDCRNLNEEKVNQSSDLTGKIALVTGGRIKIGYECVLSLLRAGALVIVTTRFPYDACNRLSKEFDYPQWKDNVHVYGVDFRNLASVQQFVMHIRKSYDKLDILINNAAQTIHRPPAYYKDVAEAEVTSHKSLEGRNNIARLKYCPIKSLSMNPFLSIEDADSLNFEKDNLAIQQVSHGGTLLPASVPSTDSPLFSSQYTLVPVLPQDNLSEEEVEKYFPKGKVDEHDEQADLRPKTSWNTTVTETHPIELLEVQLVNSIVPTLLVSQLTPMMMMKKDETNRDVGFIINVTSAEGQFTAAKYNGHHPHTNMAKAALNMLTRSISDELLSKGILVNSVDTGWITKMIPGGAQTSKNADAPLTTKDGAARILDPIYSYLNNTLPLSSFPTGCLLKHFRAVDW